MVVIAEVAEGQAPPEVVREVVRRLERGEVLILPTDTVYGLHAHTRFPSAIERIKQIKGIENPTHPFATLYSTVLDVDRWVLMPEGRERRRVLESWPGPVTWVLPAKPTVSRELLGKDRTLGIRIPGHPFTRAICTAMDDLIVSTSANRHGDPPATRREDFNEELLEEVDGVVFAKEPLSGTPSEVKRWTPTGPVVLRSRTREVAPETQHMNILMICSGNLCRSPMAEAVLKEMTERELPGRVSIRSAGTIALEGQRASLPAAEVTRERGYDIAGHRSRPVTSELMDWADLVLAMTSDHLSDLHDYFPHHSHKLHLIGLYPKSELSEDEDYDVHDPYGLSLEDYRRTLDEIEEYARCILPHLKTLLERE
ncbi:hypothetical protein GF324_14540 [bacterium]|nr:hypothetical protein [bacterium]